MSGKRPKLSPLESRRQLLTAESELNRAELSQAWQAIADGVSDLLPQAKTRLAWVSSAVLLVAGVAAWRRGKSASSGARFPWLQRTLGLARLATSLWLVFRGRGQKQPPQ
jgi:hypothetical protein